MSMFSLAISCLTTSNLPWLMELTFQVPIQYCSLQHRILLPSPVTSTPGCCFCFGSFPSFFLELFLHRSPVAYWAPTDLESSSFSILSFCLFILFMGFSGQEYWRVCHSLLQWTTFCQTSPPCRDPRDYTVHGILQARILEWVAFPFSRGCLQPRNWAQASCIAGSFFSSWATREAHLVIRRQLISLTDTNN